MAEKTTSWWEDFTGGAGDLIGIAGSAGAVYNQVSGKDKEKLPTQPVIIDDTSSKSTTAIAVTMVAVGGLLAIVLISKLIGGKR